MAAKSKFLFSGESTAAAVQNRGNGSRSSYLLETFDLAALDDTALPEDDIECWRRER